MTALTTIAGTNDLALMDELKGLFEGFENEDLSGGIAQSYPIVSFKGKVWRVKHKGEEKMILDPTSGDPVASIMAVIVKASPHISKLYYKKTFTEGDDAKPDCFSLDGVKPDNSVENPPSPTCMNCPMNAWGSKVNDAGQTLKACADHKRLAIVPFGDLKNEGNGPMLLRVPPASLQNLASLAAPLKRLGVPYQAVAVRIGFDVNLAYPKLVFEAKRALTKEQALVIKEYLDSGDLDRMLMEPSQGERQDLAPAPAKEQGMSNAVKVAAGAVAGAAMATAVQKAMDVLGDQTETVTVAPRATAKQTAMDEGMTVDPKEADALEEMLAGILGTSEE